MCQRQGINHSTDKNGNKDERRIEIVVVEKQVDKIQEQVRETEEKDYEASFPGAEK